MNYPVDDELLLIRGTYSFLLAAQVKNRFALCIETSKDEYCQAVEPGDLVVVSAPEGGPVEPAVMLIDLVRAYRMPLLVLPKDHPGSRRLSCVVSVAREIHTNCSIRRGTHPEQHLICSGDELSGIQLKGTEKGIGISPLPQGVSLQRLKYQLKTEFF
jgi:hypothetical protein